MGIYTNILDRISRRITWIKPKIHHFIMTNAPLYYDKCTTLLWQMHQDCILNYVFFYEYDSFFQLHQVTIEKLLKSIGRSHQKTVSRGLDISKVKSILGGYTILWTENKIYCLTLSWLCMQYKEAFL